MFDEQIPTDDKRGELADRHIAVNVRRPRFGYSTGELGVTQSCTESII